MIQGHCTEDWLHTEFQAIRSIVDSVESGTSVNDETIEVVNRQYALTTPYAKDNLAENICMIVKSKQNKDTENPSVSCIKSISMRENDNESVKTDDNSFDTTSTFGNHSKDVSTIEENGSTTVKYSTENELLINPTAVDKNMPTTCTDVSFVLIRNIDNEKSHQVVDTISSVDTGKAPCSSNCLLTDSHSFAPDNKSFQDDSLQNPTDTNNDNCLLSNEDEWSDIEESKPTDGVKRTYYCRPRRTPTANPLTLTKTKQALKGLYRKLNHLEAVVESVCGKFSGDIETAKVQVKSSLKTHVACKFSSQN